MIVHVLSYPVFVVLLVCPALNGVSCAVLNEQSEAWCSTGSLLHVHLVCDGKVCSQPAHVTYTALLRSILLCRPAEEALSVLAVALQLCHPADVPACVSGTAAAAVGISYVLPHWLHV